MKLAVFDLDNTILPIDTGDLWLHWLVRRSGLDHAVLGPRIEAFNRGYREGHFDPEALVLFNAELLAKFPRRELDLWREEFLDIYVKPALERVKDTSGRMAADAKAAGWTVMIASGTNRYVTSAIARLLGVEFLSAVTPEEGPGGEFTGRISGGHTYGVGKLEAVRAQIAELESRFGPVECLRAWSDSVNDLPLLRFAAGWGPGSRAIAVTPDEKLRREAEAAGWPVLEGGDFTRKAAEHYL